MRLPFFKKKEFFSVEEKSSIVEAIRMSEKETSGEIRVFVESENPFVNPLDRAKEIFFRLKMDKTEHRNGVLIYIAIKSKELALFGDEGIFANTPDGFWNGAVTDMVAEISDKHIVEGIIHCVEKVGQALKTAFPYEKTTDKNELPDDIIFGH
jgi:uncharacterized membrane protein